MDGAISEILAAREQTHGRFPETARVAQELKNVLRSAPRWQDLSDAQKKEALEQIMSKIARMMSGDPDFPDHAVDIAGYAALLVSWPAKP